MKKPIAKSFLLFVVLLLMPVLTFAAPAVSGISGTVQNGQAVTIGGSGFGTKSPAAPLLWDNFESGTDGNNLASPWTLEVPTNCPVTYTTSRFYGGGTKASHENLASVGSPCWGSYKAYANIGNQSNVYVYNKYYVTSSPNGDHVKMLRITAGSDIHQAPDMGYTGGNPDYYYIFSGTEGGHPSGEIALDYINMPTDTWTTDEYWAKLSTNDVADGTVGVWRNGVQMYWSTSIMTKQSSSAGSYYNTIYLPYYTETNPRDIYVDDVYADNTLARVMICNGSTWASKGTCEIQIPSAWSDTSATATVNQGAFADSSSQYLYVVDSTGAANSNGYSVTFSGGTSDTTAPANPSGLSVL